MKEQIVKYLIALIPLLIGAYDLSEAVNGFVYGRYFKASAYTMLVVWMICLFVKIFFEL